MKTTAIKLIGAALMTGLMTALVACGSGDPEEQESAHPLQDQLETIDRAKQVEQTLQEADQLRRDAVEATEMEDPG